MLKKFFNITKADYAISTPVASVIFTRIIIKILLFLSAIYFHVSYQDLFIIILIFLISEIYRNIGTILSVTGKLPADTVGAIVSAIDGALIIILLAFTGLLNTDLYLFIFLSIAFDTIEYGINASFAEGVTASFTYAAFMIYTNINPLFLLVKIFLILALAIITGWLSETLKNTQNVLYNTIIKTKEEEKLNDVKNEFVNIASHNLRTPISIINGYLELLTNERPGKINKDQKEYLETITENIEKLRLLIEDLLNIVLLQNHSISIDPSQNNIFDFIDAIVMEMKGTGRVRGISVNNQNDIEKNKTGIFDSDKIKIAIANIIQSAIYNAKSNVSVHSFILKKTLTIEVKNNGVGMTKEDIKNIFDEEDDIFKSIQTLQSKKLSVYISNIIIKAHKGNIKIISIEGVGTTFKIQIPL
ncbi:HAMP domain-containing histidine kinase [Patescibacteria group bacterium]|nr:HAMP domain-containing histidine kinase [Patescibacteria group bacterium]